MKEYEFKSVYDSTFIGRKHEEKWLRDHYFRTFRPPRPILVSGFAGIGKTTLIKQFLASTRLSSIPYWVDLERANDPQEIINHFLECLYVDIPRRDFIVVVDGSDFLSSEQIHDLIRKIYNVKATRGLIFIGRESRDIDGVEHLNLVNLDESEAGDLVAQLMDDESDNFSLTKVLGMTKGHPLAISLLAKLLKNGQPGNLESILSGHIYDFSKGIALSNTEIITNVRPRIISATDYLIQKLRKQPQSIYDLAPRKFEELLAELLTDMGWEVELTKATRDGGKDILAYLDTEVGKMLCLVEAKKYREDRKVGVDLVRSLYGTLYDHRASSAMLVTTSSFTSGAKEFQEKYEYQLSLRDYSDLVQWIQNYKSL